MPTRAEIIHQTMVAEGFARYRDGTRRLLFRGALPVRGKQVTAEVAFDDDTLTRLPTLRLRDRADLPGVIGHIDRDDGVCFARNEELQLDPLTPAPTVALCLLKMREGLDRIASANLTDDIEAEFPQHWLGNTVMTDLTSRSRGNAMIYSITRGSQSDLLLTDDIKSLHRFGLSPSEKRVAQQGAQKVALIRTDQRLRLLPGQTQPATMQALLDWANSIDNALGDQIVSAMSELPATYLVFFIHAPNGCVGGRVVLPRLVAEAVRRKAFLASRLRNAPSGTSISRLVGTDVSADFIFRRNLMDQPNLGGLTIALVGAGTIGGHLSKFLTQSGAGTNGGRLTIFDPQAFTAGNVGRHFLGVPAIGLNKAEACRDELARLYPDNAVAAVSRDFFQASREYTGYDLIIDATGEQSVSDVINERGQQLRALGRKMPPMLFGWLEGNGVAARGLLVTGAPHACFRCLRQADASPRFKVIHDDHPAKLTPANCGEGAYFAYGVGASAMAAGLLLQMALDVAADRPDPRMRTLRIVHEATLQLKDQSPERLHSCPVCGSR